MLKKGISIGAVGKGNIENLGIFQSLLHPAPDRVIVVFGLNNGDRHVGFVVKDVVRFFCLTPLHCFSTNHDTSFCKKDLFTNLRHEIPFFS